MTLPSPFPLHLTFPSPLASFPLISNLTCNLALPSPLFPITLFFLSSISLFPSLHYPPLFLPIPFLSFFFYFLLSFHSHFPFLAHALFPFTSPHLSSSFLSPSPLFPPTLLLYSLPLCSLLLLSLLLYQPPCFSPFPLLPSASQYSSPHSSPQPSHCDLHPFIPPSPPFFVIQVLCAAFPWDVPGHHF